jgi:hypothetical protein
MNTFQAVQLIEGGEGSEEQRQEAWQHLVDTGTVWYLQGSYARTAVYLIASGMVHLSEDAAKKMEAAQ